MKTKALPILLAVSALLAGSVILVSHPELTWHDQQRLGQIVLFFLAFFGALLLGTPRLVRISSSWYWPAVGVMSLGATSAALAMHPVWAATEYALLVASLGIGWFIFCLARHLGAPADLALGGFLRLLLASMVFQFYVSFVAVLGHPDLLFTPWSLLYGFSNMRFEGQFLTIVVPLLGAALSLPPGASIRYPRGFDGFLMVSLAGMVFVAGTRGSIAAWLAVCVLFWGLKGVARTSAKRMLLVMAAGYVLAWLILHIVAWVTGQPIDYRFSGEQVFGLSAREILWVHAWATILEHPWLGVGPMHFAALGNRVAAHPHQALLQIGSEWGLPVLAIVVVTVAVWLLKAFAEVRARDGESGSDLRWALLFAVLSSIVQSMVDGVLVMPYPQLWLAIVVGWCSARCLPAYVGKTISIPAWIPLVLWAAANIVLLIAAVTSYPDLVGAPEYCGGGPRFWCSGRI